MNNKLTATIIYKGNLRTQSTHLQSGSSLITDAPIDNQGKGEAFSPTDLVATALASCMMTIMGIKARDLNVDIEGAKAEVIKVMSANPRRIAEIIVDVSMPATLSSRERKVLEAAAHACPVAQSLHPETLQTFKFHYL